MGNVRISRTIEGFYGNIITTNDYLVSPSPLPYSNTNGERLGWSPDELAQWELFLTSFMPLFLKYSNKRGKRTSVVIAQLHQIIDKCRKYEQKRHLYDRIASNPDATLTDFSAFNIKRGTPLAASTHTKTPAPGDKTVTISIKLTKHMMHQLLVVSPHVEGRAKEKGVKSILIFVAYTGIKDPAPEMDKFQYYGDVFRGLILVEHPEDKIGLKAWFVGRTKNSRGVIGVPGKPESGIVT